VTHDGGPNTELAAVPHPGVPPVQPVTVPAARVAVPRLVDAVGRFAPPVTEVVVRAQAVEQVYR